MTSPVPRRVHVDGDRLIVDLCTRGDFISFIILLAFFPGLCLAGILAPETPGSSSMDGFLIGLAVGATGFFCAMFWPYISQRHDRLIFDADGAALTDKDHVRWRFTWDQLAQVQIPQTFIHRTLRFVSAEGILLGQIKMVAEPQVTTLIIARLPAHIDVLRETIKKHLRPRWWHMLLAIAGLVLGLGAEVAVVFLIAVIPGGLALLLALGGFALIGVGALNVLTLSSYDRRLQQPEAVAIDHGEPSLENALVFQENQDGVYSYPPEFESSKLNGVIWKFARWGFFVGLGLDVIFAATLFIPNREPRSLQDVTTGLVSIPFLCAGMGAVSLLEGFYNHKRLSKGFGSSIVIRDGELFLLRSGHLIRPDQHKMVHVGHGKYELLVRIGKNRTYYRTDRLERQKDA
jgi:hypothetical protein